MEGPVRSGPLMESWDALQSSPFSRNGEDPGSVFYALLSSPPKIRFLCLCPSVCPSPRAAINSILRRWCFWPLFQHFYALQPSFPRRPRLDYYASALQCVLRLAPLSIQFAAGGAYASFSTGF
ncbi:hypothetical protein OROMI_027885 [Orobanche minor]